ncbi:MAG: ribosome maturation factor RimM [Gemmatimonadota bacterium]
MERPQLLVGRVARPHGLRGEVSVALLGDDPTRLTPGRELRFERPGEEPRTLRVASSRPQQKRLLVRFEGIATREEAERLAGGELSVPFDPSDLGEGEYYPHQLEGLRVVTVQGQEVGRVAGLIFGPGRIFLELAREERSGTALIPFHPDIVKAVDVPAGSLTIDPPDGLLDL